MTADEVARFRREIVEYGALPHALGWYRALPLLKPGSTDHKTTVPTTFVWSDRDIAITRGGAEATARLGGRAVPVPRAERRQPLDPDPGARRLRRRDHRAGAGLRGRCMSAARARAAAAPGRRQPLPPRHRARRRPRRTGAGGAGRRRRRRRTPDRADRLRPARRPVGGRGGRDVRRARRRGGAAPQRGAAAGRRSTTRWPRSRRWPVRTTGCARWGRPGSTTSAPARRGGPCRRSRSGGTSTSPSGSTRPW